MSTFAHPLVSLLFPYTTLFRSWTRSAPHTPMDVCCLFGCFGTTDDVWCLFGCFGTALRAGGAEPLRRGAPSQNSQRGDRKSTRLNSSHQIISYAVLC